MLPAGEVDEEQSGDRIEDEGDLGRREKRVEGVNHGEGEGREGMNEMDWSTFFAVSSS
jgi:hypothetical protein